MRINALYVLFAIVLLTLCGSIQQALACPDGQYEQCVNVGGLNIIKQCICVPNSGTIVKQAGNTLNPLPDTLKTVDGVIHGDVQKISQGVGGLIIKGGCPECDILAQNIMDENSKAFVEEIVGRGWLLYAGGGSPTLVVVDAATSAATKYIIHPPIPPIAVPSPSPAPIPADRKKKTYIVGDAACMVSEGKSVVAGFADAPQLTEQGATAKSTYPNVDLIEGDIWSISSDTKCGKVPKKQKLLTTAKIIWGSVSLIPGTGKNQMHYLVQGKLTH